MSDDNVDDDAEIRFAVSPLHALKALLGFLRRDAGNLEHAKVLAPRCFDEEQERTLRKIKTEVREFEEAIGCLESEAAKRCGAKPS